MKNYARFFFVFGLFSVVSVFAQTKPFTPPSEINPLEFGNRHAVTARRVGWLRTLLIGAVVFVGYAPFLSAGQNLFAGFLKFAREWQFNAGAFALIRSAAENFSDEPAVLARYICGILILGIVVWLVWRDDLSEKTFVKSAAIILGALIVLSPTVMPWYLSWVLPFAVLARQNIWFYFSALVLTAFHILIDLNEYALALWFERRFIQGRSSGENPLCAVCRQTSPV